MFCRYINVLNVHIYIYIPNEPQKRTLYLILKYEDCAYNKNFCS